ncbi:hypothetical protein LCGC14_1506330 [marine sediment metagenome]|uniref:Uncharacterized protein n=1 Tax=marine sediment metagenome TaxID=412755 RepID=A0A0F9JNE0_9ZZZZ
MSCDSNKIVAKKNLKGLIDRLNMDVNSLTFMILINFHTCSLGGIIY